VLEMCHTSSVNGFGLHYLKDGEMVVENLETD
jgi:hypothetical protein